MQDYVPKPIDTSKIKLPDSIEQLIEILAENTHEVWARQRLADGWSYGSVRDDIKRLTPCLVKYNELPEEEKEYDRQTAVETLKFIIAMGYEIIKS